MASTFVSTGFEGQCQPAIAEYIEPNCAWKRNKAVEKEIESFVVKSVSQIEWKVCVCFVLIIFICPSTLTPPMTVLVIVPITVADIFLIIARKMIGKGNLNDQPTCHWYTLLTTVDKVTEENTVTMSFSRQRKKHFSLAGQINERVRLSFFVSP